MLSGPVLWLRCMHNYMNPPVAIILLQRLASPSMFTCRLQDELIIKGLAGHLCIDTSSGVLEFVSCSVLLCLKQHQPSPGKVFRLPTRTLRAPISILLYSVLMRPFAYP